MKILSKIYIKVENVSAILLVVSALTGLMLEELMIVEEEEAVRQEEGLYLAAGLLISLPRPLIPDQITVIITV